MLLHIAGLLLKHFWGDSNVPLQWRTLVFHATVFSTALSGLEAVCLTRADERRIEGYICKRLRFLLQGMACSHDNEWVRRKCCIHTVTSTLHARRLRLFRGILRMMKVTEGPRSPLPAVLLGPGREAGSEQLAPDGRPTDNCNPFLSMFVNDVQRAMDMRVLERVPADMLALADDPGFQQADFRKVRRFDKDESEDNPTIITQGAQFACGHCGRVCVSRLGLRIHTARKHEDRTHQILLSSSNQCPWCEQFFAPRTERGGTYVNGRPLADVQRATLSLRLCCINMPSSSALVVT